MNKKIKDAIIGVVNDSDMSIDSIGFENNTLYIVLDSDEVIDLDRITEVSRTINKILDEKDLIKDSYMLDISSKEKGE